MLYLARRREAGFIPASTVASALGTPPNYTSKTLRQLARKGLLRSERGPSGGFLLAGSPHRLSVSAVLDAVDEVAERPGVCLLGDRPCDADQPCSAHATWTALHDGARELFDTALLADFLADESASEARSEDNEKRPSPGGLP
jgi:Rrf2 family protein